LITVRDEWKDARAEVKGHGKLRDWQGIIRAHSEGNRHFAGVIGVIIGSKIGNQLIFRSCAFDSEGELAAPLLQMALLNLP